MSVQTGASYVEALKMQGRISATGALVLQAARVRSAETLYAFLSHFPGVARTVGLDRTQLTSVARGDMAAHDIADVDAELAEFPPPSTLDVLGALEPPNAQAATIASATVPMPIGPLSTVSHVTGPAIDHRPSDPWPVRNQWRRGTCVGHAVTALAEWLNRTNPLPDLSEQFLFAWAKKMDGKPASDGTWLRYAASALRTHGICDELMLRYNPEPLPPDHGQVASLQRLSAVQFMNLVGYHSPMPSTGAAQQLYDLLAAGTPVALSVAVFVDPTDHKANNWNVTDALWYGEVGDPLPTMIAKGGHAVCVTGYTPSPDAAGGGWFILRNSWGDMKWGSRLPSPGHVAPAAGWGAISAEYIEKYAWEMLAQ